MIQFSNDPNIGPWSRFVFWFAIINTLATMGFTVVVIIGGIFDLKFLFKALREESVDVTDDGRVAEERPESEARN